MSVPLHEVIEAFANTIEDQSGECVAELRSTSGQKMDLVSVMREWSELCREQWNACVRVNMIRDLRRACMRLSGADLEKVLMLAETLSSQGATAVATPHADSKPSPELSTPTWRDCINCKNPTKAGACSVCGATE